MEESVFQKFREALRLLSFRRYGMAAQVLEELRQEANQGPWIWWLAYSYRRMRRYEEACAVLEGAPGLAAELESFQAEGKAYHLFRTALDLQGQGRYQEVLEVLKKAQQWAKEDPELQAWIEQELAFYRAPIFQNRGSG